jgi:hypothetical protein
VARFIAYVLRVFFFISVLLNTFLVFLVFNLFFGFGFVLGCFSSQTRIFSSVYSRT